MQAPKTPPAQVDPFVQVSAVLTGFSDAEIEGTGLTEAYAHLLQDIAGPDLANTLISRAAAIIQTWAHDHAKRKAELENKVIKDKQLGLLAQNLIQLWYLGTWNQLPEEYAKKQRLPKNPETFIPSSQAYLEGLVWPAVGAHPMAGKQPGFATWSFPPPPEPAL